MSNLVVTEFLTLDGVMEAPHEWSFPYWDEDAEKFKHHEMFSSDAILLGRVTYEGFAEAWPSRNDEAGFADQINSIPKFVVSATLKEPLEWNNSTLIKGDLAEEVSRLKQQFDQDIVIHGSCELVNTLMKHDVIDEYRLMVYPLSLGTGKRLFQGAADTTSLKLVDNKTTGTGVAILTYQPA